MKASFAMAVHFHQPVGNFDQVIENACRKCYLPFLEVLEKYPLIKINLHFTGCLFEWIEDKDPALFEKIRELTGKGQVEILSGGFYEPILPVIPKRDRISQVKMLSGYITRHFGQDPAGAWVAERVWEPSLPSDMFDSGIKYVVLDDTHFIYSGIPGENLRGYYITEDNGKTVAVFPSDKNLRYYIPYKMPEEIFDYMRKVIDRDPAPVFIYGDDGEKFGEWPGTYDWVYKEKWLENFFEGINANSGWLETMKFSDILASRNPMGRVYLSTASYEEMLSWALPADRQEHMEDVVRDIQHSGKEEFYKPFVRGGFWRNFLSKYPESNNMNKRMIYVSNRVKTLSESGKYPPEKIEEIEKYLFRAQCNCGYWHGVFGGLYLFHLRAVIYENLIRCEKLMDELVYGQKNFCSIQQIDIDADSSLEVIMENRDLYLCFDPAEGGALKELDHKKYSHNFINSLARRKEAYHRKIREKLKDRYSGDNSQREGLEIDKGIESDIYYDWYNRYSFLDHFMPVDTGIDSFSVSGYKENGDFVKEIYNYETEKKNDKVFLSIKRDGHVSGIPVRVIKNISLAEKGSCFSVEYRLENISNRMLDTLFGIEFNITMPFADSDIYSISYTDSKGGISLKDKAVLRNGDNFFLEEKGKIFFMIKCDKKSKEFWTFPLKTVSQSEKAYELNYQSTVVMPVFRIRLKAGKSWDTRFKLEMGAQNSVR
jgi:alpha-amylase